MSCMAGTSAVDLGYGTEARGGGGSKPRRALYGATLSYRYIEEKSEPKLQMTYMAWTNEHCARKLALRQGVGGIRSDCRSPIQYITT